MTAQISTIFNLFHPGNNKVSFFKPTDFNFLLHTIPSLLYPHNSLFHSLSPPIQFQLHSLSQLQIHNIDIPINNVMLLAPSNITALQSMIFDSMCNAFSIPDYYGYHFQSLYSFLIDLSWLQSSPRINQGHVLILSLSTTDNTLQQETINQSLALLQFLWDLLSFVALSWKLKNKTFHTLVGFNLSVSNPVIPHL